MYISKITHIQFGTFKTFNRNPISYRFGCFIINFNIISILYSTIRQCD